MKKYLPIVLVGVVMLALAVGGWYLIGGRSSGESIPAGVGQTTEPKGDGEQMSLSGKLKDLLNLGKAVKCTWQDAENNTGTVFVKGSKIYAEGVSNGVKNYYIQRDNCTWIWQEGENQGYKMCFEPKEAEEEETDFTEAFSMNSEMMNYSCVPQVINDTQFEAPTGVEFTDFSQMMQPNLPNTAQN